MNPTSFPSYSSSRTPNLQAPTPDEVGGETPRLGPRHTNVWSSFIRWIQENTFAPEWLPERLRHPAVGYLIAAIVEGVSVCLILGLLFVFPSFAFHGIITLVGVVLVALGWGAGPGFVTSLVGTFLLYFIVLPPHFSWRLADPADGIGLAMYLVVGSSISMLAGQNERARRQTEKTAQLLAQAESRSRRDTERMSTVLDVLPAAVMMTGPQGQLLAMNRAAQTLWGGEITLGTDITRQDPNNQNRIWWAGTGQPLAPEEQPLVRALSSGEAVMNDELEIETLDGKHHIVLGSAVPIRDSAGTMIGAVTLSRDVTERRQLEHDVAMHAQELDAIFETMTDGVYVYDAEGRATHLNATARGILGPVAGHLGTPIPERVVIQPPLDEEGQPLPLEQVPSMRILHGEVLTGARAVDVYLPTPDGDTQVLSVSGKPLRSSEGAIAGAVVLTRDITERHRLEREAALHAQELEAIFEAMTDGIAVLDSQGNVVRTNQAFRRLHGLEQESPYLALPLQERLASLALRGVREQPLEVKEWPVMRLLRGDTLTGVDITILNLRGSEIVLNVSGAPMRDHRGHITGCVEVFRDVTDRQHLEQRTRETLGVLVAMAEAMVQFRPALPRGDEKGATAPDVFAADTTLPLVARRLAELTQSVLGCRHVSITAMDQASGYLRPVTVVGLHPEEEPHWWASWSPGQRLQERYSPAIAVALAAGEPVLLDTYRLPQRWWDTLGEAQSVWLVPMLLGEELVGILLVDYPEPDHKAGGDEEILLTRTLAQLGALVLERDRLLRGWAETRANELALGETKTQMDTFLGIASHELKTPLTSLKLSLQLSQRRLRTLTRGTPAAGTDNSGSGELGLHSAAEQLGRTAHQMERLEALVNDLVDVSRIQAGKLELRPEPADLAATVREVVEAQREAAPSRSIEFHLPATHLLPVSADAGRVEQVVTNYLTNALKYSPADRPVEVGIALEPGQVRVWVRDFGPGLPPEEQEQIWERFHRVRGVEVQSGAGVGLGLGLYISRMIIERHQGEVGVQSALGAGSTFWFTLPLNGPSDAGEQTAESGQP